MENIEIYRDENMIVEIDGVFDAFARQVIIKTVKLKKGEYQYLLENTLEQLIKKEWNFKGSVHLESSSCVPVIEKHKKISLIKPFDIFECVFDLFSLIEDFSNKDEMIESLKSYYKEKDIPFFIDIYDKPIFNVSGVVAAKVDNVLLVSFFKIDENNRENY